MIELISISYVSVQSILKVLSDPVPWQRALSYVCHSAAVFSEEPNTTHPPVTVFSRFWSVPLSVFLEAWDWLQRSLFFISRINSTEYNCRSHTHTKRRHQLVLPTVAGLLEQGCVAGGLPDFVRLLISRRVNWMGRVVSMGEKRNAYRVLVEKLRKGTA